MDEGAEPAGGRWRGKDQVTRMESGQGDGVIISVEQSESKGDVQGRQTRALAACWIAHRKNIREGHASLHGKFSSTHPDDAVVHACLLPRRKHVNGHGQRTARIENRRGPSWRPARGAAGKGA